MQLDVDILGSENMREALDCTARFVYATAGESSGERPFIASRQADQSSRVFLKFFVANCTFTFFGAQLHLGGQAAEVVIARAGLHKKRKTAFTREARRHGKPGRSSNFRLPIAN